MQYVLMNVQHLQEHHFADPDHYRSNHSHTRRARVIFLARVKLPRFNADNFCEIRRIQAKVVVVFHKITGVSENLSAKTDNMFKIPCLPQDPQPLLHFQVKSSSVPKTENAKVKLFNNTIAAVLIWT